MPKVLIICDVFPPSFAPRMGYLVKYMKAWDWAADIVTRGHDGDFSFNSLERENMVIRVNGVQLSYISLKDKLFNLIIQKKVHIKNADLISQSILQKLESANYNLILCSTSHRTFILEAAAEVSKSWNKPWIADIRDIHEQLPAVTNKSKDIKEKIIKFIEKDYQRFLIRRRNDCIKSANAVVTISPWHVGQMELYNKNTALIFNGYCPEQFYPELKKDQNIFKIIYTGSVFDIAYQDPTFLFLAIKKLEENGVVHPDKFRVQFFTQSNRRSPVIQNPAYNAVSQFIDFYDYIDTSELARVMNDSSVLLLLTNKQADGNKGIYTTKYFEYLAVERPILCVRSDESYLEDSIGKANAGIAARTVEQAYNFLLEKWQEWEKNGFTSIEVNRDYTQQFSRKLQAKQFVDLFEKVISK